MKIVIWFSYLDITKGKMNECKHNLIARVYSCDSPISTFALKLKGHQLDSKGIFQYLNKWVDSKHFTEPHPQPFIFHLTYFLMVPFKMMFEKPHAQNCLKTPFTGLLHKNPLI